MSRIISVIAAARIAMLYAYFQALRDVGYTDNDADRIYDKALRQKAKNAGFDIQKYIFERIRAKRIETLGG